jgi:hypothetical protein
VRTHRLLARSVSFAPPTRSLRLCLAASLLVASLGPVPAFAGLETLLSCDFDAEPLDELIENGGPDAGQPISLGSVPATVRAAPMPTPSLELVDDWGPNARAVVFEFLGGAEVSTGTVEVSMALWFSTLGNYDIGLREQGANSQSFCTLHFQESGVIRYGDADTTPLEVIGAYTAGEPHTLRVVFDLDDRTYDVELDGAPIRTAETCGVAGRGIGRILVGHAHDADAAGAYFVDDLVVTATDVTTSVEAATWSDIKAWFR